MTNENCDILDSSKDDAKVKIKFMPDYKLGEKWGGCRVSVSVQGETYAETLYMQKKTKSPIRKISKTEYKNIITGQIGQYKERDGKYDESLKQTFARLRGLIRTNFTSGRKDQIFITLTYKDRRISTERLGIDFKNFTTRLRRHYPQKQFEYIAVIEPQADGTWHVHLLLKVTNEDSLYIKQDVLQKLWGQGIVFVEELKSVDDTGAYYVAYFTDVLDESKEGTKQKQKAERLKYYPKNFKFYRCSRGIKEPEKIESFGSVVDDLYGRPKFEQTFAAVDQDGGDAVNIINKRVYKRKMKLDKPIIEALKEKTEEKKNANVKSVHKTEKEKMELLNRKKSESDKNV